MLCVYVRVLIYVHLWACICEFVCSSMCKKVKNDNVNVADAPANHTKQGPLSQGGN